MFYYLKKFPGGGGVEFSLQKKVCYSSSAEFVQEPENSTVYVHVISSDIISASTGYSSSLCLFLMRKFFVMKLLMAINKTINSRYLKSYYRIGNKNGENYCFLIKTILWEDLTDD